MVPEAPESEEEPKLEEELKLEEQPKDEACVADGRGGTEGGGPA